jgi:hypothetical protein
LIREESYVFPWMGWCHGGHRAQGTNQAKKTGEEVGRQLQILPAQRRPQAMRDLF